MKTDYKETILLPKTDFAMRGGLPNTEPKIIEEWTKTNLFSKIRESSLNFEKFILHDGPPYANGNLHIGTALNKILKDVVSRSQQMMGYNSHYVPGWDCHGLPIEWQVEQNYRKSGKNKDDVPILQFRKECRDFANKWIDIQREEFKRLGVEGDWLSRYATMDKSSEAQIAREICKFLMNGGLYRGAKPVMWSIVEKTALAEAEVEYHDHTSTAVIAKFKVRESKDKNLEDSEVLIWTTTPWTLPGNRAIAFGVDIDYVNIQVKSVDKETCIKPGEKYILSKDSVYKQEILSNSGIVEWTLLDSFKGSKLNGSSCFHPFLDLGYIRKVPLLEGDFVSTDQGTGFVHIAPAHGIDDFELGKKNGLDLSSVIDEEGCYLDTVPIFAGKYILSRSGKEGEANKEVLNRLEDTNNLFHKSKYVHSYPHSWRSKAPVVFLSTPQWFISMNENDLRKKALDAIQKVKWFPKQGKSRIYSMIEKRPEWVVSRQRAWGVPITVFVNKITGEPLKDNEVNKRIFKAFEEEGSDAWFEVDAASRFLGSKYDKNEWEKIDDIVDVWFESGCSHSFVLENNSKLKWPASLYLEGTDQHRGWFHSSLLESCGTRGVAPFESVLTHGFVMDGNGRKMSKSLGNVVSPQKVISKYGADILRLWVVGSDYTDDLRISDEILQGEVDTYRKIRNTLRFILGNLSGFDEKDYVHYDKMPSLERWVLLQISQLDRKIRDSTNEFDFHSIYVDLRNFCVNDLSAFYFDIRKDVFYCDSKHSLRRRSACTVLDILFNFLTAWLAPILCFTAEEAWKSRDGNKTESVHLRLFPDVPYEWSSDSSLEKWEIIRNVRKVITGAIEVERREKRIGSSLEVKPKVFLDKSKYDMCYLEDMEDICITSDIDILNEVYKGEAFSLPDVTGVAVLIEAAEGEKCLRCWKVLNEVKINEGICDRCLEVVNEQKSE
ncbi:isoleucine--tRNA ligase [Alphaproteobacteria bacterium]|nr:isoleucine--tRNA ligase [Alphaproteobacteria bacterium]